MAGVIVRALVNRRGRVSEPAEITHNLRRIAISADAVNAVAEQVGNRRVPYAAGRSAVRDLLVRAFYERYVEMVGRIAADANPVHRSIANQQSFKAALDTIWPSVSAGNHVRELLSSHTKLAAAAAGVLTPGEQRALIRKAGKSSKTELWTEADGALVDEALDLIEGRSRTYGHAVVDEAQDLSPMQARMLARRCPAGSMTILGDIAQGTGVWARDDWDDLLQYLPDPAGQRVEELRLGYRAPGQVLDLASRLLPVIAPNLAPTESIRRGRTAPELVRVDSAHVASETARRAAGLLALHHSVAVIAPSALLENVRDALHNSIADLGDADRDGLDHPVTLLSAANVKGLEFDAVVVVEPARIVDDAPRGLRLLYITLTRPTQHLTIVHAEPLPGPLGDY